MICIKNTLFVKKKNDAFSCNFLPVFPFIFIPHDPVKWEWERFERQQVQTGVCS